MPVHAKTPEEPQVSRPAETWMTNYVLLNTASSEQKFRGGRRTRQVPVSLHIASRHHSIFAVKDKTCYLAW
jgi:hypothetical protein